ncbi:hypothetical protein ACX93W_02210 [Paenibacillus sp. CAU 1782]
MATKLEADRYKLTNPFPALARNATKNAANAEARAVSRRGSLKL